MIRSHRYRRGCWAILFLLPLFTLTCSEDSPPEEPHLGWIEVVDVAPDPVVIRCGQPREDIRASMTLLIQPVDPDFQWNTPLPDARITRLRVSNFLADGSSSVLPTFEQSVDIAVPYGQPTTTFFTIVPGDRFTIPPLATWCVDSQSRAAQTIKGWLVVQFWGATSDGYDVEGETRFRMEIQVKGLAPLQDPAAATNQVWCCMKRYQPATAGPGFPG